MNNFFLHFSVHFFMHIDCECFLYFGWIVPSLYIISEGLKWFGSFGNSVVSRRLYGSIAMSSCFHVHPYRPMLITLHIRRLRFHMPWLCVCVCFLFVCLFWNTGAIATTKDVCVFFSHVYLLFFTVLPSARRVNQSSNVAKIQPCSKSLLLIQNDLAKNFGQL